MSKTKAQLKGPPGLRMLAVLFTHPDACFLSAERMDQARFLNLKYAKCVVDNRESGPITVVVLCTKSGAQYRSEVASPPRTTENELQQLLEAYLDGVYDGAVEQTPQRLQS